MDNDKCWRKEYNQVRPHSSLGYRPPAPETIQPDFIPSLTLGVVQ
ncbi:MAG: transposase [Chloroflexi bacterium]|nr:transposase [Chloroflexota bacterium]